MANLPTPKPSSYPTAMPNLNDFLRDEEGERLYKEAASAFAYQMLAGMAGGLIAPVIASAGNEKRPDGLTHRQAAAIKALDRAKEEVARNPSYFSKARLAKADLKKQMADVSADHPVASTLAAAPGGFVTGAMMARVLAGKR